MKKIFLLIVFVLLAGIFSGLDVPRYNMDTYTPVFMSREVLEKSVTYIPGARDMLNTGKIYYRAPYIYINERYKGVHVINNSVPAHPVNEGFILAPGCIDMAVKENILYLDNAVDLVSFDLDAKKVTNRIKNVFPEPLPPEDNVFFGYYNRPEGFILVEWKKLPL